MVLIVSNPNEDSQGTQLRVNKKLTTVCSGKRSRFSKPRPNLSISKRGETNTPVNAGKTSEKSQESIAQEIACSKNLNSKKTDDENIKVLSEDNVFKSSPEKDKVLSQEDQNSNQKVEENVKVLSYDDDVIKNVEDSIEKISYENTNNFVLEQHSQVISSTNSEVLVSDEISGSSNSTEYQISNTENLSPNEESQAITNLDRDNIPKNCDTESTPAKSSRTPETEKRSTSNVTTTVIDKSKYPHLTSILSKKRTEPKKETQQKRRRKFKKGDVPPERSKMTMADLIYWNPAKTDEPQKSSVAESETSSTNVIIEEENVDDSLESENNIIDSVPKLVISEDGQINIDQSSLFVSRNIPQPTTTEVVRKDDTTYSSFRKRPLTKHWTSKDTANFYRALSLVGADFSLMEQIFPNRSRRELKQKFKREEKFNIDLINKVLYESQTFDELTLNAFIDQNNTVDDPDSINEKDADTAVKEKSRKRRTSKKTETTNNETRDLSTENLVEETTPKNEKQEKKKKRNKTKKLSDDEDIEMIVGKCTNYNDTGVIKSSKRKRCAKKLPDDFINLDTVQELEIWSDDEEDNQEMSDAAAIESQENDNDLEAEGGNNIETGIGNGIETENDVEEISSESACVILNKIMNGTGNTDDEQNHQEKVCDAPVSLPVTNHEEEYISVEYIKNDGADADLGMISDVVAYEVVNTQTPPPKKRRKINPASPLKTRDYFLSTKISPANYTNYTPV